MIGSIINEANSDSLVLGAGLVASDRNPNGNPNFSFVRGNLTVKALAEKGIDVQNDILGDPAVVLPQFYKPKIADLRYELGVIPHVVDVDLARNIFGNIRGVKIIDLNLQSPKYSEIENIIDSICSCKSIISSSLHGLIVAHAYGIPGAWCEFSDRVIGDGFKFRDYFSAYSRDYLSFDRINFKDNKGYVDMENIKKISSNFLLETSNSRNKIMEKFNELSPIILDTESKYLLI
jgi:hypothetical protein